MEIIKAGVIGDPIEHSLSPTIHNHWLKEKNIKGKYEAIKISKNELEQYLLSFSEKEITGINITIPHKESAYHIVKNFAIIDETTKKLEAINCLYKKNNKIYATNTDYQGFKQSFEKQANLKLEDKKIALIGIGGAGKAILHGLLNEKNNKIYLINRTYEKALFYQQGFENQVVAGAMSELEEVLQAVDVVINTSSMGLNNENNLEIDFSKLKNQKICYDIVYKPEITKFLSDAKTHNHKIITGLGMLIYQAQPAFEHFFQEKIEVKQDIFTLLNEKINP